MDAERVATLRYGENPHQAAAFYRPVEARFGIGGVGAARQLHGPELSYNNLLDFSGALGLLLEFDEPAAVAVKHANPCGAATGPDAISAFERARAANPVSIYGGIVGTNRPVDCRFVHALSGILLEMLFAPGFEADALAELRRTKKKLRVLEVPTDRRGWPARRIELRSILGGLLVQEGDAADLDDRETLRVVSRRVPTEDEWRGLRFAWKVVKHVKSNAIVLAASDRVVGVGAGQMSRVDAARLAVMRANEHGHAVKGAAVASDAFFPFRDALDVVAEAGATAVIHPGGSIRDEDVVQAADQHGMTMVLTGIPALQALTESGWVFTERDAVRLLALAPRRAHQLRRLGLLRLPGDAAPYGFRDLVALRVAKSLLDAGVTVRQIKKALETLRRLRPDTEAPFAELRVTVRDGEVFIETDAQPRRAIGAGGHGVLREGACRGRAGFCPPGSGAAADAAGWRGRAMVRPRLGVGR